MNLPRQDGHSSEVLCAGIFMCRIWPYVLCICINYEHLGGGAYNSTHVNLYFTSE